MKLDSLYIESCVALSSGDAVDYKALIPDANLRRRMSKVVKAGVAAGLKCLDDAGLDSKESCSKVSAIITATGLGCLEDSFKFGNSVMDNKEDLLNPSPFISSTFNTVGGQIALLRSVNAYNNTYVNGALGFEAALEDAFMCMQEGYDYVLVGAFDERTAESAAMELSCLEKMYERMEGNLHSGDVLPVGQEAVFFLMRPCRTERSLAQVNSFETDWSMAGQLPSWSVYLAAALADAIAGSKGEIILETPASSMSITLI